MKAGGTTRDLEFSLETVACYGSCALAPVVVVNNVVHRQQTSSSLATLLAGVGDLEVGQKRGSGRKHTKASSRAS
jgi:NADH:ubiquinone oxidoreductase subunit E